MTGCQPVGVSLEAIIREADRLTASRTQIRTPQIFERVQNFPLTGEQTKSNLRIVERVQIQLEGG